MQVVPVLFIAVLIEYRYMFRSASEESESYVGSRRDRLITACFFGVSTVALVVAFLGGLIALRENAQPDGPFGYLAICALSVGVGGGILGPAVRLFTASTADIWTDLHRRMPYSKVRRALREYAALVEENDAMRRETRGYRLRIRMSVARAYVMASRVDRAARTLSPSSRPAMMPKVAEMYALADGMRDDLTDLNISDDRESAARAVDYIRIRAAELEGQRRTLMREASRASS